MANVEFLKLLAHKLDKDLLEQRVLLQHEKVESIVKEKIGESLRAMLIAIRTNKKKESNERILTEHELQTAKFKDFISDVLTKDTHTLYKSKIFETSIRMDKERKMVIVDSDAVHGLIEKEMRRRQTTYLKTGSVDAYVQNQFKAYKERLLQQQDKEA